MLADLSKHFWGHPKVALPYVYDKHQSQAATLNFIQDYTSDIPIFFSNCSADEQMLELSKISTKYSLANPYTFLLITITTQVDNLCCPILGP